MLLSSVVDERFLTHRLKSTSTAGIVSAVLALCLFGYHYYLDHRWSWELFALAMTFLGIKLSLMAWYRLTD